MRAGVVQKRSGPAYGAFKSRKETVPKGTCTQEHTPPVPDLTDIKNSPEVAQKVLVSCSNRSPDDAFFLQWTAIIGSHVHSFRDR